jgi:hypothetical protein
VVWIAYEAVWLCGPRRQTSTRNARLSARRFSRPNAVSPESELREGGCLEPERAGHLALELGGCVDGRRLQLGLDVLRVRIVLIPLAKALECAKADRVLILDSSASVSFDIIRKFLFPAGTA